MSVLFDIDALGAPQGKAEDFLAALTYRLAPDLQLRAGYRMLEGGSNGGGSVYSFALFNYAIIGARYSF